MKASDWNRGRFKRDLLIYGYAVELHDVGAFLE